jgi:hypothetical protein
MDMRNLRDFSSRSAHTLDEYNSTASEAVAEEAMEVGQTHVEQGASGDATSQANNGWSPSHVVEEEQGNAQVVRILVEHAMDVAA